MKTIFILGTAGAGKSLLASSLFDYYTTNGAFVGMLNLDPGVENLPYTCDADVRDYVDIVSIMRQYDLGPNGAIIMANDLIASKIDQIQNDVDNVNPDYLIVDTPGQIELFAYRSSGPFFVQNFVSEQKVALFLHDGVLVTTPTNFVSIANLGPGFDCFGLALDAYYDEVYLEKSDHGIKIQSSDTIPLVPEKNSA